MREANQIPPRYRLASGSTILIPRDETMESDIPAASLDGHFSLVPEQANLRKVTYRVRRGDTVSSVARRWNVLPKDVIVWNRLTTPSLFAGQRLELTVPAAQARKRIVKKTPQTAGKPTVPTARYDHRPVSVFTDNGFSRRQAPADHRGPVESLDRLWHSAGMPA